MKTTPVTRQRFNLLATMAVLVSAGVVSCVTVNVNFPESAVQKATDDYVRDLYRSKEQSKVKPTPSPTANSSMMSWTLISEAYADEPVLKLSSAETDRIKSRMKSRIDEIISFKKDGVLGETSDGMLVVRGENKKPLLKKKIEDVVRDENSDRKSLYSEILKENKLSSGNLGQVKKSFAKSFQSESPSGTWVQSPDGSWSQKP